MDGQSPSDDEYDRFAQVSKALDTLDEYFDRQLRRGATASIHSDGSNAFEFQIFDRTETSWMGHVSIYRAIDNVSCAAIDYYMLNQFWRKGIATEAVRAVLQCCWRHGLHRIEATIEGFNERSLGFAKRLGMQFEGIRREGARINGRWQDLHVYSTLVGEIN